MSNNPAQDRLDANRPKTLDYQRLTEATDLTVQWDTQGPGSSAKFGEMVDLKAVYDMAMERAKDIRDAGKATLNASEALREFTHAWYEGFMHGVLYKIEAAIVPEFIKGPVSDKALLKKADSTLSNWHHDGVTEENWARHAHGTTVAYVAHVRALQAVQVIASKYGNSHQYGVADQGATWADGFSMGMLFQDLGGHRED